MMGADWIAAALGTTFVLWYESAENPLVFCYRMMLDFFLRLRVAPFAQASWPQKGFVVCSKASANSSTRSTMSKG
jgi:hypothetical protein